MNTFDTCIFCDTEIGMSEVACRKCEESQHRAARELLLRINRMAEADMLAGDPITGAHHRAIEKVLKEIA